MGYLGFFGRVCTWLPPLVFAYVNQVNGGRLGVFVSCVPPMLSGLAVLTFGVDVEQGMAAVAKTLALRKYGELAVSKPGTGAKVSPAEIEDALDSLK